MRKILFILFLASTTYLWAEEGIVYEGRWHEDILSIRWGGLSQYDEYLSPLKYKGQFIAVQNEWWQQFSCNNDWAHLGQVKLQGARAFNPSYSNMIYSLGLQGGWGAHYDFNRLMQIRELSLFVGPYLDFDLFVKELIINVNKPLSVDASVEVKLHAGLSYSFAGKQTSYRVRYTTMFGILGVQFVPEYGQSYYEITEGIIGGTVGISSWHNRLSLRHALSFDMQFRHSAWRVGVEHEYMCNSMNLLGFQREQVSLVIGTIFNYKTGIKSL